MITAEVGLRILWLTHQGGEKPRFPLFRCNAYEGQWVVGLHLGNIIMYTSRPRYVATGAGLKTERSLQTYFHVIYSKDLSVRAQQIKPLCIYPLFNRPKPDGYLHFSSRASASETTAMDDLRTHDAVRSARSAPRAVRLRDGRPATGLLTATPLCAHQGTRSHAWRWPVTREA